LLRGVNCFVLPSLNKDNCFIISCSIQIYLFIFLKASKAAGKAQDIRKMMNTFTLQMGYPVVTITKSSKQDIYNAVQDRFLYLKDPNANYSGSPFE